MVFLEKRSKAAVKASPFALRVVAITQLSLS